MNEGDTILCRYTCELCGVRDAEVSVPMRAESQDVVVWLETVAARALVEDHATRSPGCRPESFANIKIPISGADYIGGPTKH